MEGKKIQFSHVQQKWWSATRGFSQNLAITQIEKIKNKGLLHVDEPLEPIN